MRSAGLRGRATAVGITLAALSLTVTSLASCTGQPGQTSQSSQPAQPSHTAEAASGIGKIRHVVIIMQENRSFDSFFGTYPGADGIPASHGQFTVCAPDPRTKGCDKPYHDPSLVNGGAGHNMAEATADIDGGKMDGFVRTAEDQPSRGCSATNPPTPVCLPSSPPDVMGYHDAREIPNYWTYAHDFVLQDHMFEPVDSWSLPSHLYLVSGWSARCTSTNPDSCVNDPAQGAGGAGRLKLKNLPAAFRSCLAAHGVAKVTRASLTDPKVIAAGEACLGYLTPAERQQLLGAGGENLALGLYSWTDLTYLLHKHGVSWAYYVQSGIQPDCDDNPDQTAAGCAPVAQGARTPSIWNPLPSFTDVKQDGQLGDVKNLSAFYTAAGRGHPARGLLDRPDPGQQRPPAGQPRHRPGLRHQPHQHHHEKPGLGLHRDLPGLGRLGRLLRPRGPARGRPERLRAPGARPGHQPVCPAGVHRPPNAVLRRVQQVHRG